ncbi:sulfurtransferase complex subunit TusC [Buchnera aphidicola]|uniref:sulfurtransferase complex subunit TusC n=1 Tax=Buchnera aphidicola TaxID=9 RepID=UPI000AC43CC1|nr:sulfurtransferase complex subunit TusC [Buchnera aphidicola]
MVIVLYSSNYDFIRNSNKSIAFIFSSSPYGENLGREGLDFIISCSLAIKKIALFFIDDGVLQLMLFQQPKYIYSHNYSISFKVLLLYDLQDFFFVKNQLISGD